MNDLLSIYPTLDPWPIFQIASPKVDIQLILLTAAAQHVTNRIYIK